MFPIYILPPSICSLDQRWWGWCQHQNSSREKRRQALGWRGFHLERSSQSVASWSWRNHEQNYLLTSPITVSTKPTALSCITDTFTPLQQVSPAGSLLHTRAGGRAEQMGSHDKPAGCNMIWRKEERQISHMVSSVLTLLLSVFPLGNKISSRKE